MFNARRGEGYLIDLVSVDPAPGTPLASGSKVTFQVKVRYTLSIATGGAIALIFQDEVDGNARDNTPPVKQRVDAGSGTRTLVDTVFIPSVSEFRLFVPLFPDGMEETTGEIVIRYPIVRK